MCPPPFLLLLARSPFVLIIAAECHCCCGGFCVHLRSSQAWGCRWHLQVENNSKGWRRARRLAQTQTRCPEMPWDALCESVRWTPLSWVLQLTALIAVGMEMTALLCSPYILHKWIWSLCFLLIHSFVFSGWWAGMGDKPVELGLP